MAILPIIPGIHYDLPPDTSSVAGTANAWQIMGVNGLTTTVLASDTAPGTSMVAMAGSNVRVLAGSNIIGGFAYFRATYNNTSTERKIVEFTLPSLQLVFPVDEYTRNFKVMVPSEEHLASTLSFSWDIKTWDGGNTPDSAYVNGVVTGNDVEYEFPDPSIKTENYPAYEVRVNITDGLGGSKTQSDTLNQVIIEEGPHLGNCAIRGNKSQFLSATITKPTAGNVSGQNTRAQVRPALYQAIDEPNNYYVNLVRIYNGFESYYKNPSLWEDVYGNIWAAMTRWKFPEGSTPEKQCELWVSRDRIRTFIYMAEIWDGTWRNAFTREIYPQGAVSVAIKAGITPAEVWAKYSRDGVTWDEDDPDGRCTLTYVGNLTSGAKEPVSFVQRGDAWDITAPQRFWRSYDMNATWEAVSTVLV
jgi:hypothetical protein